MAIANRMRPVVRGERDPSAYLQVSAPKVEPERWGRGHFRSRDNTGPASLPLCSLLIFGSVIPVAPLARPPAFPPPPPTRPPRPRPLLADVRAASLLGVVLFFFLFFLINSNRHESVTNK